MKTFWIIIVILVVLGAGWYFYSSYLSNSSYNSSGSANTPTENSNEYKQGSTSQNQSASPQQNSKQEATVQMTDSGFSPNTLTVKVGDMVKFVNAGQSPHWPASGPHPIHTCYPGFDAKMPIQPGQSYEHKFDIAKTCAFHDHLNPSLHGTITVQ